MAPSLAAQLLQEHDQERRRLARELHSTAAQQLAALQFTLEIPGSPRAEAIKLASECAAEIRRLCYALHPPLLDEMGLVAALTGRLKQIEADLPPSLGRLSPAAEIALYRIIEEALPEISRLRLRRNAKSVILEFDLPRPSRLMRERIKGLNAKLTVKRGSIRLTVPLTSAES